MEALLVKDKGFEVRWYPRYNRGLVKHRDYVVEMCEGSESG